MLEASDGKIADREAAEHEEWQKLWLPRLDPGIAPYVDALREARVETFESCEAGDGHCYLEPTVRFGGGPEGGFRALAVAIEHDFPVDAIRRYWSVQNGEPVGPEWEMTFHWPANDPRAASRPWFVDSQPMSFVDLAVSRDELRRDDDGSIFGPRDPRWIETI
jgi:hypothetical protein